MNRNTSIAILSILLLAGCVSLPTPLPPESSREGWVKMGEISVERRFWNWFFQPSRDLRQELLTAEVQARARELYGLEAEVEIHELEGKWHPLSLALGADLLGFVEQARLKAAVWLPAPPPAPLPPPPPPEEPEAQRSYRYPVIPAESYDSSREYTQVEFKTRRMMEADLQGKYGEGLLSENDMKERVAELPPGGAVYVSLGRTEIENAISKWFTFILTEGTRTIFSRRGWDDIPYVPGGDKLWWNDLVLPIKETTEPPFQLEIRDRFQDKVYRFTILKEIVDES